MSESNRKLIKSLGLCLIGLLCLFFLINLSANGARTGKRQASLEKLTYFSDFSLPVYERGTASASGESFTSEDMSQYKVVFFNGWGPWCSACVGEMPDLQSLAEEYKEKGLLIVGVVAGYTSTPASNTDAGISGVLESMDITYPILLADERFSQEVEPTMSGVYPGSWAVASDGTLLEFVSGSRSEAKWRAYFDSWLEACEK